MSPGALHQGCRHRCRALHERLNPLGKRPPLLCRVRAWGRAAEQYTTAGQSPVCHRQTLWPRGAATPLQRGNHVPSACRDGGCKTAACMQPRALTAPISRQQDGVEPRLASDAILPRVAQQGPLGNYRTQVQRRGTKGSLALRQLKQTWSFGYRRSVSIATTEKLDPRRIVGALQVTWL